MPTVINNVWVPDIGDIFHVKTTDRQRSVRIHYILRLHTEQNAPWVYTCTSVNRSIDYWKYEPLESSTWHTDYPCPRENLSILSEEGMAAYRNHLEGISSSSAPNATRPVQGNAHRTTPVANWDYVPGGMGTPPPPPPPPPIIPYDGVRSWISYEQSTVNNSRLIFGDSLRDNESESRNNSY
jgi:hypothetical protein